MEVRDMKIEEEILATNAWGIFRILNERLMESIKSLGARMEEDQDYRAQMEGVKEFLSTLISLLKIETVDNDLKRNLREIYLFVNKLVGQAHIKKDQESLRQALDLLEPLYQAFREQEISQEVNVVSGLTYGRQDLSRHGHASKLNIEG